MVGDLLLFCLSLGLAGVTVWFLLLVCLCLGVVGLRCLWLFCGCYLFVACWVCFDCCLFCGRFTSVRDLLFPTVVLC